MKRFTETSKWKDPWFRKLSPTAKNLLSYLRDNCDCAGVFEIDFEAWTFHIGEPIEEKHLAELESRLQRLPNGKVLMPKFVHFQNGELSATCPAHKPILKTIAFHGLSKHSIEYRYPNATLRQPPQEPPEAEYPSDRVQGKGKVPVKGKVQEGESAERGGIAIWSDRDTEDQWETVLRWLADWTKNGADYTEFETRGAFLALQASGWMWGRNPVTDPRAAIERQIQTDRERKQRNGNGQPNNGAGARNLTGAQQRQVGQCQPKHDPAELADLLAKREAKRTRDALAEKAARAGQPPAENSGNGEQS